MTTTDLKPAEQELFKDPAIEAAYQSWAASVSPGTTQERGFPITRKQFLMRIRALIQSGEIVR